MTSPVYEFPYSGTTGSLTSFLNYDPNALSYQNVSPLDSLFYNQPATYTVYHVPPFTPSLNNNIVSYQVADNRTIDRILRHLGVDVGLLQQPSYRHVYYPNIRRSRHRTIPRRGRRHQRQLICREISDSDSDVSDQCSLSYYQQYDPYDSDSDDYYELSRVRHRSRLDDRWPKSRQSRRRPHRSPSKSNMNQHLAGTTQPSSPMPLHSQTNIGNLSNQPSNTQNTAPNSLGSIFGLMKSGSNQNVPPQQSPQSVYPPHNPSAVANMWNRFSSPPQNVSSPTQNPPWNPTSSQHNSMNSIWNQMLNMPAQQPPPHDGSTSWNQMSNAPTQQQSSALSSLFGQMSAAAPPPPQQQQQSSALSSLFGQMSAAAPPQQQQQQQQQQRPSALSSLLGQMSAAPPPQHQQPSALTSMWGQMSGAPPPPPQQQQQPPSALSSMFGQMSAAAPPQQQQQQQQPSALSSMWAQMSGAAPPQQPPPYGGSAGWNPTSNAPPQQQSSAVGSMWSHLSGAPTQQQSSYQQNPSSFNPQMGSPQNPPNSAGLPGPIASLFSHA